MGLFNSKPAAAMTPEAFFTILCEQGLSQIQAQQKDEYQSLAYSYHFHSLADRMRPLFQQGLDKATLKPTEKTQALFDFIYKQLSHHVMKRMLTTPLIDIPVSLRELDKNSQTGIYYLPKYKPSDINSLLGDWQANDDLSSSFLSRTPTMTLEKYCVKRVTRALSRPFHIPSFIASSIYLYREIQQLEAKHLKDDTIILDPLDAPDMGLAADEPDENGFYTVTFS